MTDRTNGARIPECGAVRPSLLLIDDEDSFADECRAFLGGRFEIDHLKEPPEDTQALERADAILLDIEMPNSDGLEYLEEVRRADMTSPIIMLTNTSDVATVVTALKAGASNYLPKEQPWELIEQVIRKEIEARESSEHDACALSLERAYRDDVVSEGRMAGRSPTLLHLRKLIERLAERRFDVHITGEAGVGKSLLAHEINRLSREEAGHPHKLLYISLPALHPNVFESELFGHEKGAFSGAHERKKGIFESVGSGDLFLDEVDCLPLGLQPKILQVLEDRQFRRVGHKDDKPLRFRGRVISAANRSLEELVDKREFRGDLKTRLLDATVTIEIPPLRERREDILPIAKSLLQRELDWLDLPVSVRGFTGAAQEYLLSKDWANGNLREMQGEIRRALVWVDGEWLDTRHFRMAAGSDDEEMSIPEVGSTPGPDFLAKPWNEAKLGFARAYVAGMIERGKTTNGAALLAGMHKSNFRHLKKRIERGSISIRL